MKRSTGIELLGENDPRSGRIGIIHVSPYDEKKSVFTEISRQGMLNREHIVIELPETNKAFESTDDLDDLGTAERKLQESLIFIVPSNTVLANQIAQRHYPTYPSLDEYKKFLLKDDASAQQGGNFTSYTYGNSLGTANGSNNTINNTFNNTPPDKG